MPGEKNFQAEQIFRDLEDFVTGSGQDFSLFVAAFMARDEVLKPDDIAEALYDFAMDGGCLDNTDLTLSCLECALRLKADFPLCFEELRALQVQTMRPTLLL